MSILCGTSVHLHLETPTWAVERFCWHQPQAAKAASRGCLGRSTLMSCPETRTNKRPHIKKTMPLKILSRSSAKALCKASRKCLSWGPSLSGKGCFSQAALEPKRCENQNRSQTLVTGLCIRFRASAPGQVIISSYRACPRSTTGVNLFSGIAADYE